MKRQPLLPKHVGMSSVLVTGSSGRIGRAAVTELVRRGHHVRGFDRVPGAGTSEFLMGTLTDRGALERAMIGMDCLVHLAATPEDADFLTELLPNNLIGVYHVLESARQAGLQRLILASSSQVNWWQRTHGEIPVRPDDPPSPRAWYAATKVFLEGIGRSFAEQHGLSVITVRLGWCPRTQAQEEEIASEQWSQDIYLSPGDAGRVLARAVEAPATIRHLVIAATSRPKYREQFDLTAARQRLGYEPEDTWPEGLEEGAGS